MNKLYYGPKNTTSNNYRLSPIPKISIRREINYANDIIIGYTYTIDLDGYISTYRDLRSSDSEAKNDNYAGLGTVLQNIEIVRSILMANGGFLRLIDSNNNTLLEANGGTLRSINFNQSDNNWTRHCPFSASIEFNELNILGESKNSAIDFDSITSNVIDITKYKIKDYKENWSFEVNEEEYNDFVINSDNGQQLKINNSKINVSYDISATGKNYYNSDGTVKAAWLQAKDFVQERLYNQLTSLIGGALTINGDLCSATKTLGNNNGSIISNNPDQILSLGGSGILSTIQNYYGIFNEGISCDTSESDGTFSLKYNSILKRKKSGNFDGDNVLHTVDKTISYTLNHSSEKIVNISVKGTVQGLVPGGLLNNQGNFQLPQNGRFLITASNTNETQFNNAELFLSNIIDTDNDDLTATFKTALGISSGADFGSSTTANCINPTILPTSFNLTKNYLDASIEYSAEYSSNKIGQGSKDTFVTFTNFSVEEPTLILAEFVIPGAILYSRTGITVSQDINTVTARKINITVEGRNASFRGCCGVDLLTLGKYGFPIPAEVEANFPNPAYYILTARSTDYNLLEGSYTINLSYICKQGCYI